jgi:hypothetical protein
VVDLVKARAEAAAASLSVPALFLITENFRKLPGRAIAILNLVLVPLTDWASEIGVRMAAGVSPGIVLAQLLVAALTLAIARGRQRRRSRNAARVGGRPVLMARPGSSRRNRRHHNPLCSPVRNVRALTARSPSL